MNFLHSFLFFFFKNPKIYSSASFVIFGVDVQYESMETSRHKSFSKSKKRMLYNWLEIIYSFAILQYGVS